MAEKNKKRGGRRAHLNDFHVNLAGDYVYTGAHYSYVDQGRSRDRVQRELLGLSVAVMLAVVAGGCSDAPAMLNCWYVILPYICEAAAAVSVIWAVHRLRKAEEPIREYIYKKSVQALPHRAMLCMIFAGLGFVTMGAVPGHERLRRPRGLRDRLPGAEGAGGRGSVAPVAVYADPQVGKAPCPGPGYASGVIHQFLL